MSSDKYLISQPVCYDASIDPNNMSQYAPKDYRVTPVYKKIDNGSDTAAEDTENDSPLLPKYVEAIKDIESTDPSPPYEQLELNDSGLGGQDTAGKRDDNSDLRAERKRKNKKFAKFALHLIAFLFVLYVIQASFSPFDCGGSDDDATDSNSLGHSEPSQGDDTMMMSYSEMDDMMGSRGSAESMMNTD